MNVTGRAIDRLLPPGIDPGQIAQRIALVSDTHAPQRLAQLPPQLFTAFAGADLILHAGDVGELWVLDQLSAVAPVIGVHGNDETEAATHALPYTQVIAVQGLRIYLWHSHFPVWEEELASRQGNDMIPKLARSVERAQAAGCQLVIFGHWHIPLIYRHAGVTVFNPGALASGNEITRQLRQTAGALFVEHSGAFHLVHIDLAEPHRIYDPRTDVTAGFQLNLDRFSATILADDLVQAVFELRRVLSRDEILLLRDTVLPLANRCWEGEWSKISRADFIEAVRRDESLPPGLRRRTLDLIQ